MSLGRALVVAVTMAVLLTAGFAAARAVAATPATAAPAASAKTCPPGYVHAVIGGQEKCLHTGEFCSSQYEAQYESYGFTCVSGHLEYASSTGSTQTTTTSTTTTTTTSSTTTSTTIALGKTVLLKRRTRTSGCKLGPRPQRSCSPGAYYSGLTKNVICARGFRTSSIRSVSQSERHRVEVEYGLAAKSYGSSLEIDHIVSLELGGSNDIANLFPEKATFANGAPGYHVKDKLENRVHSLVCSGHMSLWSAQRQIAANWEKLYRKVYGATP